MKKQLFIVLSAVITVSATARTAVEPFNRAPLHKRAYAELPIGDIHPAGWLQEQTVRMRDGMTGHLDSLYELVMGPRNGWKGGDGDVWERGPYWIDGLLPLAYILDDENLKSKAQEWIEWTLASQTEDGHFGPVEDRPHERGLQRGKARDWWPKMVMLKVMQQYYSATGDKRVIDFMTRYFRYQLKTLPEKPLDYWTRWGKQRGADNLSTVYWLYNITGDAFLLDLGELIHAQTLDWEGIFDHGDELYRQHSLHCVNLGQGFKAPAIYYQQSGDTTLLQSLHKGVKTISSTIGYPTGLWAGDEHLRFGDPTLGSELCTAVEMMFSLEDILKITGDIYWADYLERVAYNALPTQITDGFDARQYFQQLNQVEVTRKSRNFSTPHTDTDTIFGLLTGYPCCTSNLHQGWSKFIQNLWYATPDGGLAALVYAPSTVETRLADGRTVKITETTNYPFEESIAFDISFPEKRSKGASFPLHLRIPRWSGKAVITVNGETLNIPVSKSGIAVIDRQWANGDKVRIDFTADIKISRWYDNSAVVERGALIYALKMNEKWEKKLFEEKSRREYGDFYYEVTSDSAWNYCLLRENIHKDKIGANFTVHRNESASSYPWNVENAPISIKTKARRIPRWQIYNGSAGQISYFTKNRSEITDEDETIELIPYGCTTLRITEFPVR
ncbi:MAG: glycoside hydrolase family 127 protein [Alistipes sp.]|nr:glycoside hydrolase family 127 protein [Alistipes sp.]